MILQALHRAYERLAGEQRADGKPRVPPYGFSYERIGYALVLDKSGRLVEVEVVDAGELDVPIDPTVTRTSGIEPMFLWDKTAYALGLAPEAKKRTADEHDAFKRRQREVIAGSDDAGLRALLAFLATWKPLAGRLPRHRDAIVGTNVVFRLDGEGYLHDRPAAREAWRRRLQTKPAPTGPCLIGGTTARIALTHPTLAGVRGAQSSGAAIVSFNQDAFKSLGKGQGANAPISEHAAFAYTTALNHLLHKDSRQKIHIGDATTVYWAETADRAGAPDGEEVKAAEIAFGLLADPRSLEETDRSEVKALGDVINLVKDGKPLENPERHLRAGTKLYVLGLSPHVARLSVRFWEAATLGAIGRAFHQHWRDLYMEPHGGRPPALHACALATAPAPARKQDSGEVKFSVDDIFPQLSGELMRAILSGARYPGALLPHLVMRIRSDHHVHRLRISLIKAAIVRAWRLDGELPTEDYLVRSDPNDPRPARRLGRLFALLERAQLAALGDSLHAPIKDTYLGSAAATPALVFPVLVKSANHHLARLRRGHAEADWIRRSRYPQRAARRHGENLERAIGRLWAAFHDGLPSHLSTIDQGLFFVGYFQERFGSKADPGAGAKPETDPSEAEE